MAVTCFHCGKRIKGEMKVHVPPKFMEVMGLDSVKSYHPKCYEASEAAAAKELGISEKAVTPDRKVDEYGATAEDRRMLASHGICWMD